MTVKLNKYPSLFQLNTRVRLTELSEQLGRRSTLDDISNTELDEIAERGFDWLWLLSVWQTGEAGRRISRSNQEWRRDFEKTLADLKEEDIAGSGFAITDYVVHKDLGGPQALARLRERLFKRGLKLMLDFVPNHTGPDHRWVKSNPEFYVSGTEEDLANARQNYTRIGNSIFAYGRDPYFSGWPDTLQLDYAFPPAHEVLKAVLLDIASQCDGVRCDMAMLVLPDVFQRTWGRRSQEFWPDATNTVRKKYPDFQFMAEVYWDMEWTLQEQGFDFTYDKRLYDRLREGKASAVRDHLRAELSYQEKMARFLENHDEPRAAATFPIQLHKAAALITFLSPGLRFFHQGQFEGRLKRISPHLIRAPKEAVNKELQHFYDQLLAVLKKNAMKNGEWQLLECKEAWDGNWTSNCFVCFAWQSSSDDRMLVLVNFAANQSQCYVLLPFEDMANTDWKLQDQFSNTNYTRNGKELLEQGLFLDMEAWQAHVFILEKEKS